MTHTGVLAQNIDGAAQCYVRYCREGARRLGGHTYPDITVDYIAFGHTLAAVRSGDRDAVRQLVGRSVSQLRGAGADFFVCADNTAHLVLDEPGEELSLPGLHLAQLVAEQAAAHGYGRVALLGTGLLVRSQIYPVWLDWYGVEAVRPDETDLNAVDAIIFGELVDGVVSEPSRQRVLDVIVRMAGRGCDAVALVSTELSSLISLPSRVGTADSAIPVLDSADIAALGALDVALGERPLPVWRGGPHPGLPGHSR